MAVPEEVLDWVERFHATVDEVAAPLCQKHASKMACRRGCHDCCLDGLTVFPIEAAVIARHHGELLATGEPHRSGACAFLDAEGACRIYAHRPYVCRTQGLPLRWLEEAGEDGEIVESRDVCPKNLEGVALEDLESEACWTIGPFEDRLRQRQALTDGTHDRVALRSLFAMEADAPPSPRRRLPVV